MSLRISKESDDHQQSDCIEYVILRIPRRRRHRYKFAMPTFITRVEMHGATGDDYNKLHSAMEAAGFSRIIVSVNNVQHHLPTAEYIRLGETLTCEKVLSDAHAAAALVRSNPSVLVAQTVGNWHWRNLRKV